MTCTETTDETQAVYHGTHIHAVPYIMEHGFKPSFGAGCDRLRYHYGVPVPGVYVATNVATACQYAMTETTGDIKAEWKHH